MSEQAEMAQSAISRVQSRAEEIHNDEPQTVKIMDINDQFRQGDIYVTRIEKVPDNAVEIPADAMQAQLVPGNTQGARHCLASLEGIKIFRLQNPNPVDGPVIVAPNGMTIEHPEHAHVTFPGDDEKGAACYAITFQRANEDLERRQD